MSRPSPIKAACAARGITLAALAAEAGYSPGTLYLVSQGRTAPWPELRRRLADILGEDVFAGTDRQAA